MAARKKTVSARRGSVGRIYEQLKRRAITFEFRPGDRLNEGAIARQLGVSRTPLREALNRLTVDGLLTFFPNQGFFRKPLEAKEIFDLWEFRLVIESGAARLAVQRASTEAIEEIHRFLDESGEDHPERTIEELVAIDEGFHERLMAMTGNAEMLRSLQHINARIHYVRIDVNARVDAPQKHAQHRAILQALKERDSQRCEALLRQHIEQRFDQIIDAVRRCYARIYVPA